MSGSARAMQRGFTLLELLVVLVIAGIMLGVVSFNAMPGEQQVLQNDAQRIALLLQLARDEAIVRNRPIAFEAEPERYRFLIRDGALAGPVSEFTIAGNLKDMFANLTAANDLEFRYGTNVPTLRIDGMMVASG